MLILMIGEYQTEGSGSIGSDNIGLFTSSICGPLQRASEQV